MGPLSISYAIPLKSQDKIDPVTFLPADETERLQFSFGGQF